MAFHYKRFLLINDEAPQTDEANSGERMLKAKVLFQTSGVISLHLPNALSHLKLKWGAQGSPSSAWDGLCQCHVPWLCPPAQEYDQCRRNCRTCFPGPSHFISLEVLTRYRTLTLGWQNSVCLQHPINWWCFCGARFKAIFILS